LVDPPCLNSLARQSSDVAAAIEGGVEATAPVALKMWAICMVEKKAV
jgi:hypothetical protein